MDRTFFLTGNPTGSWVVLLFMALAAILIFREILTWYWKIDHIIRLLERIERNLRKEGIRYPNEEYDESYFRKSGIKIPGENS